MTLGLLERPGLGPTERAGAGADPELADLLAALIVHPETKVRLHAHRVSRRVLDRSAYLDQTVRLLNDPEPAVVRSAVRTLGHAAWKPAIPGLVALLAHPRDIVRAAAADGLAMVGAAAVPALRHAEGRARPDRRHRYTALLERIDVAGARAMTGSGARGTAWRARP